MRAGHCWKARRVPATHCAPGHVVWPASPDNSRPIPRRFAVCCATDRGRSTRRRGYSSRSNRRCRCCWPISPRSRRSASPTTRHWSSCWYCSRPLSDRCRRWDCRATTRPGTPREISPSPSTIRLPARWVSYRPRRGVRRRISPISTLPMGCTASCRRTRRSRSAVPATIPAWANLASGPRPSRFARATGSSSHWPCANMCSARIRSTRTSLLRVSRPTIE